MLKNMKKTLSILLAWALLFTTAVPSLSFADDEAFPDGSTHSGFADGVDFSIDAVSVQNYGDDDTHHEGLAIVLDYDGGSTLYDVMQTVTAVKVDQISYDLKDENNRSTFMLNNNSYVAYGDNDSAIGQAIIADFKQRDKHRIEIFFEGNKKLTYQDAGYEERTDLNDPDPNNGNGNGNQGNGNDPTTGIADKYIFKEYKKSQWGNDIDIKFTEDITDADYANLVSVVINGETFVKTNTDEPIRNYYGNIRTTTEEAVTALNKTTPAVIRVNFNDGSYITNETGSGNTGGEMETLEHLN